MIRYTERGAELFNSARQKAYSSLEKTLDSLYGVEEVTEIRFRDEWLRRMDEEGGIFSDGWYCPPPRGTAVLTGNRVMFDSLRNDYNWSGNGKIDWQGVLYAYASPVDRTGGQIGDISVTLYFGSDSRIRDHVRNCHKATMEVFERLEEADTADDVFRMSQEVFLDHGLKSLVISRTDDMPINLGHTFTKLGRAPEGEQLSGEERNELSSGRKFLNDAACWGFEEGLQFTVEPQLVSTDDESLPKITQHYVVKKDKDGFVVCNDIDRLLLKYKLIG